MKSYQETHTLQDALESMQGLQAILQELEIPNKNAMQIYLQHCCAKSASNEVEVQILHSE